MVEKINGLMTNGIILKQLNGVHNLYIVIRKLKLKKIKTIKLKMKGLCHTCFASNVKLVTRKGKIACLDCVKNKRKLQ